MAGESNNEILRQLAEAKQNIKRKFQSLQNDDVINEVYMKRTLKPIIEPLNELTTLQKEKTSHISNFTNKFDNNNEYLKYEQNHDGNNYKNDENNSIVTELHNQSYNVEDTNSSGYSENQIFSMMDSVEAWLVYHDGDKAYAPKKHGDIMKFGDKIVQFNYKTAQLIIENNKYQLTPGLIQLIFSKRPNAYGKNDLDVYRDILVHTSAHLTTNKLKIKKTNGYKYKEVISKLFVEGRGLELSLNTSNNYKYWNNADELCDRLRLLLASQAAGNNAHGNEIISIYEELYEAGIIKKIPNV